jgi:hypothetical protein
MNQRNVTLVVLFLLLSLLIMSRPTTAAQGTSGTGTRYEYCQYYRQYISGDDLDRFGAQGWDLVSFNTIGEQAVNPNLVGAKEYVLTFKRPIGSTFKNCDESRKPKK